MYNWGFCLGSSGGQRVVGGRRDGVKATTERRAALLIGRAIASVVRGERWGRRAAIDTIEGERKVR